MTTPSAAAMRAAKHSMKTILLIAILTGIALAVLHQCHQYADPTDPRNKDTTGNQGVITLP